MQKSCIFAHYNKTIKTIIINTIQHEKSSIIFSAFHTDDPQR